METRTIEARWERLIALLRPIHSQVLASARRLCRSSSDGDDLYQETVLRAFDKLHTLRDESRFRSWLYATMLSRHRNRYRRVFWKRQVPMDEAFRDGREPVGEDGTRWSEDVQRAERATEALSHLDAVQREAIVLFEIDGYTIEEIADMQGVTHSAVKSRLARGRRKLRRYYEQRGWAGTSETPNRTATSESVRAPQHGETFGRGAMPRLAIAPVFGSSGKERSK